MPAFDVENNDSWELTQFDIYKLEDLEIGHEVSGECGNFKVLRYKDEYLLFLMHEGKIRKAKAVTKSFKTLKQLLTFLKK